MNRAKLLATARLAGQVLRYHTWPVHRQQSVGEHTWQVMRIYAKLFGPPSPAVFLFLLWHDAGELVTGDPPFPFKASNPEIKAAYDVAERKAVANMGGELYPEPLNERQQRYIKTCDLIEMLEFGISELNMGNKYAEPIVDDIANAIRALWSKTDYPPRPTDGVWEQIERYIVNEIDWLSAGKTWV